MLEDSKLCFLYNKVLFYTYFTWFFYINGAIYNLFIENEFEQYLGDMIIFESYKKKVKKIRIQTHIQHVILKHRFHINDAKPKTIQFFFYSTHAVRKSLHMFGEYAL